MRPRPRPRTRGAETERGSAVIEAVIGVPAFMAFLALIIFVGRTAIAHQGVEASSAAAARSASIARTQQQAATDAAAAAVASLTNHDVPCADTMITVDTTGFAAPVGTPAVVSATVTCVIDLSDVAVPGIPGTHTVAVTITSPLDTYRER